MTGPLKWIARLPIRGGMRFTRASVASAGASMSLVAAAVSALFVVSAVVAVQGWPGVNPEDDVPRLMMVQLVRVSYWE